MPRDSREGQEITVEGREPRRPSRRLVAQFVAALAVLLFDQTSKIWVMNHLTPSEPLYLVPPWLALTFTTNTGVAFGLFKDQLIWVMPVTMVLVGWAAFLLFRGGLAASAGSGWALALITAGALGNLADRIRLGFVVDMIDLGFWPVFNVADSAITLGALILIWNFAIRLKS